jgi:transposase-like protein
MDERLRFVARLLDGEAMSEVCRAFGISRKTGYKIFEGYKEHGLEALTDRSRRPVRYANQLPRQIESLIALGASRASVPCSEVIAAQVSSQPGLASALVGIRPLRSTM